GTAISVEQVTADAEATGRSYFDTWLETAGRQGLTPAHASLLALFGSAAGDPTTAKTVVEAILGEFAKATTGPEADSDLAEDMAAWGELSRDTAGHIGKGAPLDQFLQELQLRSKEPSPKPGSVTLMTIHGAKGKEFDIVYLIGLAEDVMPSFQSRQKGG